MEMQGSFQGWDFSTFLAATFCNPLPGLVAKSPSIAHKLGQHGLVHVPTRLMEKKLPNK